MRCGLIVTYFKLINLEWHLTIAAFIKPGIINGYRLNIVERGVFVALAQLYVGIASALCGNMKIVATAGGINIKAK